jgi:enoyl-CoA hydratase/carnithine racemase
MNLHFEELTGTDGARIGIASLDAEKSLNALSLPMIKACATTERLGQGSANRLRACCAATAPRLCAGGEVRSLVEACRAIPAKCRRWPRSSFAAEYRLDFSLHTYPKPLICWGHGYVLGGGMGLLQGASIRIVTPSSRLAMPEISIGLYPDVGASWFLSRLPGKLGLFLGLTGAHMNARDAIDLDLADRFCSMSSKKLIEGLLQLNWQEQTAEAAQQSAQGLAAGSRRAPARSPMVAATRAIDELLDVSDVGCAWKAISRCATPDLLLAAPRPERRFAADRAPGVGTDHPRAAYVAGSGLPDGIHPEPQLLPSSGVQRRRARTVDRQGSKAALALARYQQRAGRRGGGAFPQGLGGSPSAGGSIGY